MQVLPIVERELRVAARKPRTWWRRVLTTLAALVIALFALSIISGFGVSSAVGRQVFDGLSIFGIILALLAGPLSTVDCLSRERREGTLGLLFLTRLRSYDVVLGKMGAASLDFILSLLALLPVVALPILLGGVTWLQATRVALATIDIMFLSLAIGVWASAVRSSGRVAFAVTVLTLLVFTLGVPIFGEQVLGINVRDRIAPWVYMFSPAYTPHHFLSRGAGWAAARAWPFWLNLGAMHALAWMFLAGACARARNSWQERSVSALGARWRERLRCWCAGGASWRRAWRSVLEQNPVKWLEGRNRLEEKALWGLLVAGAFIYAGVRLLGPDWWPDGDMLILGPMWCHYGFCLWLVIQAPRRLADDKQSGALELLLCTPIGPETIVRGTMLGLRRRFGRALVGLAVLDAFLVFAYMDRHGGWNNLIGRSEGLAVLCGAVVIPVQAWSLARVGLYLGLKQGNSLRATFTAIWSLTLLPWVLFVCLVITLELGARPLGIGPSRRAIISSWAWIHLAVCGGFGAYASWQLRNENFRLLATEAARVAWWKKILRFRASAY